MTSLRRSPRALIAALLAPALLLAGCGGEGTDKPRTEPVAELPQGNVEVPAGITLTKAGTQLKFGEPAFVAYEPNAKRSSAISLTVNSAQAGNIADVASFQLDAETKKSRPYYVRVTVKNVGTGDLSRMAIPLYAVDAANSLVRAASFSTSFPRCPSTPLPQGFGPGKTYQTCMAYFLPDNGTLVEMSYRPLQAFEPITWQGTVLPAATPKKTPTKKADKPGEKKKANP